MRDSRRTRLALGALLVVALGLITFDARGGGPVAGLRAAGGGVFGAAERAIGAVTGPVVGFFDGLAGAPAAQQRISALQREVVSLRTQLSEARLSKSQEAQLRRLLQLAGRGGYRVVAANVIAAGPEYEHTVTIDAGRADGIRPEETVVNGDGLVGTVTAATAHTATVLLAIDSASTVGVRIAGTGEIGAVTGPGQGQSGPPLLRLQVFDANTVLRAGQQVVTFGSVGGRPYVPGVPVGVITRVVLSPNALTKVGYVRMFANDFTLGVVGVVIAPPRKNPRDSVLPPKPPPPPTPSPSATGHGGAAARGGGTATPGPGATITSSPGATPAPSRGALPAPSPGVTAGPGAIPSPRASLMRTGAGQRAGG